MKLNLYPHFTPKLSPPTTIKYRPVLLGLMLIYAILHQQEAKAPGLAKVTDLDYTFHLLFTCCIYSIPFVLNCIVVYLNTIITFLLGDQNKEKFPALTDLPDLHHIQTCNGIPDISLTSQNPIILTTDSLM